MILSVLDQSPIRKYSSPEDALKETVELAKLTDILGYRRFWVSEHHNTNALAGTSPEILIAHLAGVTQELRIGSGGVMLPHYSSLKVAENFRLLEAIFPGRIDLGVGRAPGGDRLTAHILNPGNNFKEEDFIQQLYDLQQYLYDDPISGSLHERVKARPSSSSIPQQWILSSSGGSAIFAAHFGMNFAFAHFINPYGGPEAIRNYKQNFKPSKHVKTPQTLVAIFAFCSEDEEKIKKTKAVTEFRFVQFEKGHFDPVLYEDVKDVIYSEQEKERIKYNSPRYIIGTPNEIKIKLIELSSIYDTNEIMIANISLNLEDRLNSYGLIAKVLKPE